MTNSQTLGTIEATNPVLAVAPLKEETEMLRATDKITALYCRSIIHGHSWMIY